MEFLLNYLRILKNSTVKKQKRRNFSVKIIASREAILVVARPRLHQVLAR